MKHPDFDGEYLTSARLILTLMLGMGCVVSFGAELFSLPWSVVSRTMFLAIVVALVFVVGMMLCGWRPQVGRWFTLLGLSLLVHTYGLWLEIPGALGWAIIPTAYAACLVSVSAAALMALVESVWVLLLAQFLGVEGALAAVVAVWALFFAIAAPSYQTREQTKWYAGYFEQAQPAVHAGCGSCRASCPPALFSGGRRRGAAAQPAGARPLLKRSAHPARAGHTAR